MKFNQLFVITFVVLTLAISVVSAVAPFGVEQNSLIKENSTRALADVAGNHTAIAGNVTEISITAFSTTQTWAAYYGNVSGTIQLADSADNVFYNWSLADPEGEVYAAIDGNIDWTNVQCFNFTATGVKGDEPGTRGQTSLTGMNLTQIEADYNIEWDAKDGMNETFGLTGKTDHGTDTFTHMEFYTNNLHFAEGECLSTFSNGPNGAVNDELFEEVLLYDPANDVPIFVALIEELDETGFDGRDHDFQMLVLEDGHGTNVATTDYYFYVELE